MTNLEGKKQVSLMFDRFTLTASYFCVFFSFGLFLWCNACSNYFATVITNKLYFSNAVVRLKNLYGHNYFPSLALLSFASKFSRYSFIVRLVSLALFLISSWTFPVTVMHLYPFRGKPSVSSSVLYGTIEYIINGETSSYHKLSKYSETL